MRCARIEHADALSFDPGRQFDAVAIGGAVAAIPDRFRAWLKPGGRMFVVRGMSPVQEAVTLTRTSESGFHIESLFETDLPYLHGAAPVERFAL
jgi:protein-L-isoaspartate(D-aspartate) O-methyltransferase